MRGYEKMSFLTYMLYEIVTDMRALLIIQV